jgi:hypothetical protein
VSDCCKGSCHQHWLDSAVYEAGWIVSRTSDSEGRRPPRQDEQMPMEWSAKEQCGGGRGCGDVESEGEGGRERERRCAGRNGRRASVVHSRRERARCHCWHAKTLREGGWGVVVPSTRQCPVMIGTEISDVLADASTSNRHRVPDTTLQPHTNDRYLVQTVADITSYA